MRVRAVPILSVLALLLVCGVVAGWLGDAGRPHRASSARPQLVVRWHGGQVHLAGTLPDAASVAVLVEAAASRTGDPAQVNDQIVLDATARPLPTPARWAALLRAGEEGWVLRWSPGGGTLHGAPSSPAVAQAAEAALRQAAGPAARAHWAAR